MSNTDIRSTKRPDWDQELVDIADFVCDTTIDSDLAFETAQYCLMDTLACGFQALDYPACTKLLGPAVPGATLAGGARVPGTSYELEPVMAAFNIGAMNRWLDFNDTWLAAEWGHPSDNLGGILAIADYLSRQNRAAGKEPLTMRDVLEAMIRAHEIQGVLALENSYNRVGLDHVLLVRVASTAVVTRMLGGDKETVLNALSHAWIDGGALRTYRHAPNTGSRKSWAAGDATSRAVRLALIAMTGEMGYPSALSAKTWGYYDVLFKGNPFGFQRGYGSYVMENVLFKISFPAEFHSQTAVEAAMTLHDEVKDRLDDIDKVVIETQEAGVRIIDKTGPLDNPADRDHCIQYMTAVPMIFGRLTAADYEDNVASDPRIDALRDKMEVRENEQFTQDYFDPADRDHCIQYMAAVPMIFGRLTAADYEDDVASDPRIDALRDKMEVRENEQFTQDYFDPAKRYIGNALQVFFKDGSSTDRIAVDFPIGHRERRAEGIPVLKQKFVDSVSPKLASNQWETLSALCADREKLSATAVDDFMALLVA